TDERSVATAIRNNDIIAVWMGGPPDGCTGCPVVCPNCPGVNCFQRFRVYAQRLRWNSVGTPTFVGGQFIVDSDPNWTPVNLVDGHPTVAIGPSNTEFVVAWNADYAGIDPDLSSFREIHAQYFQIDGDCTRTLGREFRVTQDTSFTDTNAATPHLQQRYLGDSSQHTCGYRTDGGVVFAWTRGIDSTTPNVEFTILPAGFAATQESVAPCKKGDCNGDGFVNGTDIQIFIDTLLAL